MPKIGTFHVHAKQSRQPSGTMAQRYSSVEGMELWLRQSSSFNSSDMEPENEANSNAFCIVGAALWWNSGEQRLSGKQARGVRRLVPWSYPYRATSGFARKYIGVASAQHQDAQPFPAVITFACGGRTEIGSELHAIWRHDLSATPAGIETVSGIGKALAIRFGGDPHAEQKACASRP